MSYRAAFELQAAIYACLRAAPLVTDITGDAIFDARPVSAPKGPHIVIGVEDAVMLPDSGGSLTQHELSVSVLSGRDETGGFAQVKQAAAAVCAVLETADPVLDQGRLAGLRLRRARARRAEKGHARRVDLSFRATVDFE